MSSSSSSTTFNFDNFENPINEENEQKFIPFNYCIYCEICMIQLQDGSYQCNDCGYFKEMLGEFNGIDDQHENNGVMKKCSRSGAIYSITIDYTATQKKQLLKELLDLNNVCTDETKIPKNILRETAEMYNKIQTITTDKNGKINDGINNVEGETKWVRRGRVKKEIMGAILYYLLIKHGVARQKNDIIKFMGFQSGGLSQGILILEDLILQDVLKSDLGDIVEMDTTEVFIDRYLTALGLNEFDDYKSFIIDIINESIRRRIGVSSMNNSKIVGTIYLLIKKLKLDFTIDKIETACDNKRKNTFTNFTNEIEANILKFYPIFKKYKIPTGLDEKYIVRVKKFKPDEEIPEFLINYDHNSINK